MDHRIIDFSRWAFDKPGLLLSGTVVAPVCLQRTFFIGIVANVSSGLEQITPQMDDTARMLKPRDVFYGGTPAALRSSFWRR